MAGEISRREFDETRSEVKSLREEGRINRHTLAGKLQEFVGDLDRLGIDFGYLKNKVDEDRAEQRLTASKLQSLLDESNKGAGIKSLWQPAMVVLSLIIGIISLWKGQF